MIYFVLHCLIVAHFIPWISAQNVNPCISFPCLNGGNCTVNDAAFVCECADNAAGTTCSIFRRPCSNDSVCDESEIPVCVPRLGRCGTEEEKKHGLPGGTCEGEGSRCTLDKNAVCTGGLCACRTGYTVRVNQCVEDGSPGGMCDSDKRCPLDCHARCVDGMCICKKKYTRVGARCARDGKFGGACRNNRCNDKRLFCDIKRNQCLHRH